MTPGTPPRGDGDQACLADSQGLGFRGCCRSWNFQSPQPASTKFVLHRREGRLADDVLGGSNVQNGHAGRNCQETPHGRGVVCQAGIGALGFRLLNSVKVFRGISGQSPEP